MDENLVKIFTEMKDHLSCYINARADLLKLSAREIFQTILLSLITLLCMSSIFLVAFSFLIFGLTQILGKALGEEYFYIAYIITGGLFLLLPFLLIKLSLSKAKKKSLKEKIKKYGNELEYQ